MLTMEPTVFVVDDDPAALSSMTALVQSMALKAAAYSSAEEFLDDYDEDRPGCLVADVRMAGMSGIELLRQLLETHRSRLPVILITAHGDVAMAVQAMQAGAATFLEKPCPDERLATAIEEALARDRQARQQVARLVELRERLESLTPDERRVLDLMVAGKANKVIASKLDVSLRTVEARRQSIFRKTRTESLAELVMLVAEVRRGDQSN